MNRLLALFITFFLLNNCSFNENSRIWKEKEKDLSEKEGFQVEVSSICTICNSSFNSYRENKTTARQFGVIWK